MARSYATVGQMMTFACSKTLRSHGITDAAKREAQFLSLLGHLLEFVTMTPRSRSTFARVLLTEDLELGNLTVEDTHDSRRPDLSARILPEEGKEDDGALLLIALGISGPIAPERVEHLVSLLGDSPRSHLLLLTRKGDRQRHEKLDPKRIRESHWGKVIGKLAEADPAHGDLWTTIGQIGLTAGLPIVQYPVNPMKLINSKPVAREFRAFLDVFVRACRSAVGTAPRFSTQPGARSALLQAGDSRGRWGLRFSEVLDGSPIRFVRAGEELHALALGPSRDADDEIAETMLLSTLAVGRGSRGAVPPAPRDSMIGQAASPELEASRRLLWAVFNPVLLAEQGFALAAAAEQPPLEPRNALSLRLVRPEDGNDVVYTISVGSEGKWNSLVPRVEREASGEVPAESYAVAPRRGWSAEEFVEEVHKALFSLTVPLQNQDTRPASD